MDDVPTEANRLRELGVHFTQEPLEMGPVTTAVFDDTCGNLIQIFGHRRAPGAGIPPVADRSHGGGRVWYLFDEDRKMGCR